MKAKSAQKLSPWGKIASLMLNIPLRSPAGLLLAASFHVLGTLGLPSYRKWVLVFVKGFIQLVLSLFCPFMSNHAVVSKLVLMPASIAPVNLPALSKGCERHNTPWQGGFVPYPSCPPSDSSRSSPLYAYNNRLVGSHPM